MARLCTQLRDPLPRSFLPVHCAVLQRKCACGGTLGPTGECQPCRKKKLQRKSNSAGAETQNASAVPPIVREVLRSPGQPLDDGTRAFMEPRFGHDLSRVRVNAARNKDQTGFAPAKSGGDLEQDADRAATAIMRAPDTEVDRRFGFDFSRVRVRADSTSAKAARALNSRAFTVGHTIAFGAGEFAPTTSSGKELLAHELAHVLQQQEAQSGTVPGIQFKKDPKKETKKKEAPKAPADKERTKWRLHYKSKPEAESKFNFVKQLGLNPEEPTKDDEGWTFFYFPRTEAGAKTDAIAEQKRLGDQHTVTAEFSDMAKSWFVKSILKCPEGIPEKKGFRIWPKCFSKQKEADAQVKKFKDAHINAETVSLTEAEKFGVYFQPMTEKDALAVGNTEAGKRPGFAEGMYTVKASEKKELDSFTYGISTGCPPGFTPLGAFELTAYVFALETEFPLEPKVKDPCGLKGEFNRDFLLKTKGSAPLGVQMEGSGITRDQKMISWAPKKDGTACFALADCANVKIGGCAQIGRTVAVDPSVIPLRSELLIEDIGARVAEDTGDRIKNQHIDVYYGALPSKEANLKSFKNKKVCLKKKSK
jgi:3D (Asp-Asp-Asp) domain-containing protein